MITKTEPPEETLRRWATHLDCITEASPGVEPFRDCMSDALVWPDETNASTPVPVIWALRFIFHHRTGLIIGESRPYAEMWQLARELFPHWVGFQPSRCSASPLLAKFYTERKAQRKETNAA